MKTDGKIRILAAGLVVIFLVGCSSHQYARKCNGKKGVKTNMGVL